MQDFLVDHVHIIAYATIIVIFGFGIIAGIVKQYKHDAKLHNPKYKRTVGDIVDLKAETKTGKNGRTTTLYYSIIEFEDEQGKKFRYVSEDGTLTEERKNSRVPIYYNADDPTDCVAQTNFNGYIAAAICLVLGALFLFLVDYVIKSGVFA